MAAPSPRIVLPLVLAASALATQDCARPFPRDAASLAQLSVAGDRVLGTRAISALRAQGQVGLDALLAFAGDTPDGLSRYGDVIDRVAGQADAHAARLFWHEDLASAGREAVATGRPILSLRMLGRLDEDLSCANSRFFRSILYPNGAINAELREHFVLHWESVRPVPKLTVDFGDGRKLETTITGNSVHYILTPDGQAVDALPGLYGPSAFLAGLERAGQLARRLASLAPEARGRELQAWHSARLATLEAELAANLREVATDLPVPPGGAHDQGTLPNVADDIIFSSGSFLTWPEGTKSAVELSLAKSLVPRIEALEMRLPTNVWARLARLDETAGDLDADSRRLIESKTRARASGTLEPLFERLRHSVAEDTVRNEHVFHAALHSWFAEGTAPPDLDALNARVYRELFRSDTNDAWLGMVPPDTYFALDGGGLGL